MHNENYYRSKIPVRMVLLFFANILLVGALEVLLIYKSPVPLTAEALSKFDSSYENCTILQEHQRGHLWCYLVETETGETRLVPMKAHGLVFTRGRIFRDQIVTIPEDVQETTYNIKIGIRTSTVTVSPEPLPYMETQEPSDLYMRIEYAAASNASQISVLYTVIGAVLTFLELAVIHLIKGH